MSSTPLPYKLHELAPFSIGTVIKWPGAAIPSRYSERALDQFSSFTPEKVFKAAFIQPERDNFSWHEADSLVAFAAGHGKRLHGHTLLWDRELPSWILHHKKTDTSIPEKHVHTIVDRYKKHVRGWDVANEAFDELGNLRHGIWSRVGGLAYLDETFRVAARADPDAHLFYNEFDLEINPVKRRGVIGHLSHLRSKGVPVHGIGMQLHLNISSAQPAMLEEAFTEIAEAGFLLHLSEVDISVNPYHGTIGGKEELLQAQAKLLYQVVEKYLLVPPAQRYGITFWGVGDTDSWITQDLGQVDYPLLFDDEYEPKPAWYTLAALFNQKHGH